MNAIDLDIRIQSEKDLPKFLEMAETLGYSAVASSLFFDTKNSEKTPQVYRRINLGSHKLSTLKKQATSTRSQYTIISIPILGIDTTNWAAEDSRIDILTVDWTGKNVLRKTTASLSAKHDTFLEVSIAPLLTSNGLDRSRIIKHFHESLSIAVHAGMKIILSSGATTPIQMRSPVALRHIGMTLGLDRKIADEAIITNPQELISRNLEQTNGTSLGQGIKIVRGDDA